MKIIDSIKEHTIKILLSGLFAILVFLAGSMYHDLSATFLQTILEATPKPLLLKLLIVATIIVVLMSALSLYFYLKNKTKLIPKFGVLWDKNKEAYCPSCKIPLSEYNEQEHGPPIYEFICMGCGVDIRLTNFENPISLKNAQKLIK